MAVATVIRATLTPHSAVTPPLPVRAVLALLVVIAGLVLRVLAFLETVR